MDTPLIGPGSILGYPAPYWFLLFFKVLGFTLHMIPMNLWLAGLLTALILRWRGGAQGTRLGSRLINAMPVAVALGINLGIVPLLFTQVAYHQVFYPATILMAWPWFAVVPLLMVAYYGVYVYVVGLRTGRMTTVRRLSGWIASGLFVVIGFIFANSFSLMTNIPAWTSLWEATAVAGAPMGVSLNTGDASLLPRWLMMFGLALMTTAAYAALDATFLAREEGEAYSRWVRRFAFGLHSLGVVWFAAAGSWYVFLGLDAEARGVLLSQPWVILSLLTALAPGLPWLLLLAAQRRFTRALSVSIALGQFGVLGLNAISRQVLQNAELAPYLDLAGAKVSIQWSPMILFLVLFVGGLAVIAWMVRQAVLAQTPRPVGDAP